MDKIRILTTVTGGIFMLCLPVLILSASIGGIANSLWFYEKGFDKYNVGHRTGLTEPELEKAGRGLISYFNSGEEFIDVSVIKDGQPITLFNQREIVHLNDVKGLIRLDYWILLGTILYVAGYAGISLLWQRRRHWRRLAWGIISGGGIALAFMIVIGLAALLNFQGLFLQFHLFIFANDFWQLDPTKDYLIMLFPQGFFYDATILIASVTLGTAIILAGAAGAYLWFTRARITGNSL